MFIRLDLELGSGGSNCMHCCALAGTGVCNFAWQGIHSGIDCPISGGRGSRPLAAIATALGSGGRGNFNATMHIESSHGRPDPRWLFLGLATDPTRQDSILLWWQALDAALALPQVEQELTRFNRDEQAAFCSWFHTGQNVSFYPQDGMHTVSRWRVHGNFVISGARLPFNKTKDPNGPENSSPYRKLNCFW